MQKKLYAFLCCCFVSVSVFAQSKINITSNIPDAKFFMLRESDNSEVAELGVGSIELKLSKDSRNRIKIVKEGYEPLIKEYPRTIKWEKEQKIALENRLVDINVEPYDAEIYVDGRMIGTKRTSLVIGKGKFLTLEVKKAGFAPITKIYYNAPDREAPPIKDFFEMKDRQVRLEVFPADATVQINGVSKGRGTSDITIPNGECVTVNVVREGYADVTQVFCNKPATDPAPPIRFRAALEDRLVKITTAPADANIEVAGKILGVGKYDLKVPKNDCVEVRVVKDGFIRFIKNYCNQTNMQEPPLTEFVEMAEDEAYNSSISTDMANVRITIPVNKTIAPEDAWRTLSSIITRSFDVLETVDYNTGYLTTSWQVQNFNGMSTIRTRMIVSSGGNSNELTYVVKIISQRTDGVISVKEDQLFSDWGRLLKRYGGIIEELQSRLQ
ncbi:hypothetical protein JAO76_11020 [Pontibacter sp. BT310]|uniref:PEGA domain-containing protein n=1 Tax=Pontibacter populi TaxID=890055 RepID=A0ABS6XCE0_9BACT|nr:MULTISPECIES: hypothetical protein [Pontibacter]MBJ6118728.1 hypothetical protein [Pontibacter sp. BT310]MBR0571157.1 hypothetical protein [Microvirga sp. STS03]MBW3365582.1 hypothetical protein [Pontibacter populi]